MERDFAVSPNVDKWAARTRELPELADPRPYVDLVLADEFPLSIFYSSLKAKLGGLTEAARRGFASDNAATIHPEVIAAIERVNVGHAFGYGHDRVTEALADRFAEAFGEQARAFAVWGGTAANVLCLRAACRPWDAVICTETAHLNVDECGAPEAIAGVKLLAAPTEDGKLTPASVERRLGREGDEHAVQPRVVSISQCTELGTVYTVDELAALVELAHARGLLVHVDGARLANAAASLRVPLRAITTDVGVDMLSFGGTKNGLLGAEAVVFLEPRLADGFEYLRKQSMQLASKMRFVSAQLDALLRGELWLECATRQTRWPRCSPSA